MAVYGDMLAYFPELMRPFSYFSMSPKVGAGFNKRTDVTEIYGIYQEIKAGTLKDEADTWNATNIPVFFTNEKLEAGKFISGEDNMIYRITKPNDWQYEGDFICYTLETITGNTDVQQKDIDIVKPSSRFN